MEKVKKIRNILPLIFICIAILLLIIHLGTQMIETNKSKIEITNKYLQWTEKPVEFLKMDSIWNGTEFMPE